MLSCLDIAYYLWSESFRSFEIAYGEVADAGVQSVVLGKRRGELDLTMRSDALKAGRILAHLGLRAPACHGISQGACHLNEADGHLRTCMIRDHARLMQNAADLGCRTYVLHIGPEPRDEPKAVSWDRVRSALDQLAPRASALGLTLALENGLPGYLATNAELPAFVDEYGCPEVALCYDSGHAHVTADAASVLRAFSRHVVTVHLHDNDASGDHHLIPGQGTIAWAPVVEALAGCPRLLHAETEAVSSENWAACAEVWPHRDVYARYCELLHPEGACGCHPASGMPPS